MRVFTSLHCGIGLSVNDTRSVQKANSFREWFRAPKYPRFLYCFSEKPVSCTWQYRRSL